MPQVELDENEIASLPDMRRVYQVATLINNHPKGRELMQAAVLEAAPNYAGPEARIRAEVATRESALEKKIDEFLAAQAEEKQARAAEETRRNLEQRWSQGRQKAMVAGYTGDALKNLEEFMEKNEVADHEIAISHFERLNPPPPPSVTGGARWNFFDQIDAANNGNNDLGLKALLESGGHGDEAFLARAVPAALADVRGGR